MTTCLLAGTQTDAQPDVCVTGWALRLVPAAHDAAPGEGPGPRGAALLSACPQQAVIPHPGPARSHWQGRSTARALDLERANDAPGRSVEVPTDGGSSWGRNGSVTPPGRSDVPSEVGGGAVC